MRVVPDSVVTWRRGSLQVSALLVHVPISGDGNNRTCGEQEENKALAKVTPHFCFPIFPNNLIGGPGSVPPESTVVP